MYKQFAMSSRFQSKKAEEIINDSAKAEKLKEVVKRFKKNPEISRRFLVVDDEIIIVKQVQ